LASSTGGLSRTGPGQYPDAFDPTSGLKADALKVSVNSRTVHIALHITEAELKRAYEMQMARNAAMPGAMPGFSQPLAQQNARPADAGLIIQSSEKDMGVVTLPPAKNN
jgi:hypothetical protein